MKRQATIKKPWPAVVIPRANDLRYEIAALVTHRHIRNLKTSQGSVTSCHSRVFHDIRCDPAVRHEFVHAVNLRVVLRLEDSLVGRMAQFAVVGPGPVFDLDDERRPEQSSVCSLWPR